MKINFEWPEHDGYGTFDKKNFFRFFGFLFCRQCKKHAKVEYSSFFCQNIIQCPNRCERIEK